MTEATVRLLGHLLKALFDIETACGVQIALRPKYDALIASLTRELSAPAHQGAPESLSTRFGFNDRASSVIVANDKPEASFVPEELDGANHRAGFEESRTGFKLT